MLLLPRVSREVAFEWWLGLIHTGWQGLCAWCPGRDAESALSLSLLGIGWGLDPEIIKAEDARSY